MKIRQSGFTLVELMIVVVIVGILAAVAVPSYGSYKIKTSRAMAQTELMKLASLQEKIYLNSSAYSPNISTAYTGEASGGLSVTLSKTEDGRYDLTFNGTPAQSFEIRAKPVAGTAQEGDGCLLIKDNGTRQWYKTSDDCTAGTATNW